MRMPDGPGFADEIPPGGRSPGITPAGVSPPCRQPAEVLAWSESLTEQLQGYPDHGHGDLDGPYFALWQPLGVTAALGISQKPELELDCAALRRDGVGLLRRQSGGGAVLLYPGVLCWEAWVGLETLARLSVNSGSGIHEAYAVLTLPVRRGLSSLGVEVFAAGVSDLSYRTDPGGAIRKVAGTAQFRKRDRVLVHGALLVTAEVAVLSRYLAFPSVQPDYRGGRQHRDFCLTVGEILGVSPAEKEACFNRVAGAVRAAAEESGWTVLVPPEDLPPAAAELARRKYRAPEWNWEKVRQN